MKQGSNGWFGTVGAVCGVLALVITVGGIAVGQEGSPDLFSDIATSPFRDEINRIGRAGCASGFPDGTFQPRNNVNRQQFAFWTNNCGGRLAFDTGQQTVTTVGEFLLTEVQLTAGATAEGGNAVGGFVLVSGTVRATSNDLGGCPCRIEAWLENPEGNEVGTRMAETLIGPADHMGHAAVSLTVLADFTIAPGATEHFQLLVGSGDPQVPDVTLVGDLTALYVPFGADGDRAFDVGP
jgi:S-layer homology domain